MHAALTTDGQRFCYLMSLVCEDLPTCALDALGRQGHAATAEQLRAVRQCRKVSLPWLIDLVRVSLPDFPIPAQLLPAATLARVVTPL